MLVLEVLAGVAVSGFHASTLYPRYEQAGQTTNRFGGSDKSIIPSS
jgi:hypothetical protein